MTSYAKIFSSILDSTIWREPDPTRILWITMLALADRDGIVHCTAPGLADRARINIDQCRAGLLRLSEPDEDSLTQEYEGRRIRRVESGWFLINYEKYRHLMSDEDRKEKARVRAQRFRDRHSRNALVTPNNASNDIVEVEVEVEAEVERNKTNLASDLFDLTPKPESFDISKVFEYFRKKAGKSEAYLFSEKRKEQGLHRWKDALKISNGDIAKAKKLLQKAIDALCSDDFMNDGGYVEWDKIFRSTEDFTKWIEIYEKPRNRAK